MTGRNSLMFTPIVGSHDFTCERLDCIQAAMFEVHVEGVENPDITVHHLCALHTACVCAQVVDTTEHDYRRGLYDE